MISLRMHSMIQGILSKAQRAPEGGTGLNTAHIHIRKILLFVSVTVLVLLLSVGAYALTDASSIQFDLSVEPSTLKAPGPVTAKVSVTNNGTEDITVPMTLYDADDKLVTAAFDGGALNLLKVGETRTWEGSWTVSQKHLDAGKVTFYLRLNTTDATGAIAQVSISASSPITFEGEKVELQVTRTINPEVVRPGSTVTVTYELVNNGTVKLNNIAIRENNLISRTTRTVGSLEPGRSTITSFEKKIANAGVESSAVITYRREGANTQLRQTVDTLAVPLAKPGFSAELTTDNTEVTIGEKVKLTLTLTNNGNISYTDIKVTDPKLGEVFTGLSLPAGQTVVQSKEITMMVPTNFKFSVLLQDNTGVTQTETTNEIKVSAYQEGQRMRLNVQLSADRDNVEELPGLVRFTVVITNDSNTVATPVNLYYGDARIASIEKLEPGQSNTITREFNISQAGRFRFSVRTVDALNNTVSFDSNELSVGFVPPTPAPTQEVVPTVPPVVTYSPIPVGSVDGTMEKGRDAMFILVWALGILFAGSLVLFLASSLMRARARAQSQAAYDHLEVAPKRDFADPTTYQDADDAPVVEPPTANEEAAPLVPPLTEEELPHHKYLKEDVPPVAETAEETATEVVQQVDPDLQADPEAEKVIPTSPLDDEGGYQLVRGEDEAAPEHERRTRRAAKHHPLPQDDE